MLNKYIAKQICLAQVASDGGKGIADLLNLNIGLFKPYYNKGYSAKDACIRKAIKAICKKKNSGFYFFVKPDDEGVAEYIVYFNFKLDGQNLQVSFHTFGDFGKYCNPKAVTRWKKKVESRDSVILLAEFLQNNKEGL